MSEAIWDEGVPSKCAACEGVAGVTQHTLTGRCKFNPSVRERMFTGIRVGSATSWVDGAKVKLNNDDGWVHVEVETHESVKGWAVTVNGKELP